MKEQITHYLCQNNEKYLQYHTGSANSMVIEVQEYFESGSFITAEVCDFLVSVIAEVFNLTIHVYQKKPDGNVQVHNFSPDKPEKEVHLKFTHNNAAPGGNHYDCVVRTSFAKKEMILDQQKTNPVNEEPHIPPTLTATQNLDDVEVIDLTQEINTTGNTTGESSFGFEDAPAVKRGVCFPTYLYSEMEPIEVDRIPGEIDGTCWYRIKCSEKEYTEKTSDLRWFMMRTSSRTGLVGRRKVGSCQGSYICSNKNCSYLSTEGKPNEKLFDYLYKKKVCRSCGVFAEQKECNARKLIEFHQLKGICEVYHYGEHNCIPKEDKKGNDSYISEQIKKYPNLPPKALQVQCVKEKVSQGDIKGAQDIGRKLADRNRVRQLRSEMLSPDQNTDHHSMEAVAIFKEACDKSDPFHIFKMNDSRMNTLPDFVFKTSRLAAELGLLMDQENEEKNVLQQEDCYFDGAHSRCRGFISLALWLFHTSMRRLLKLACMEVRSEGSEQIGLFFKLWNEVLRMAGKKTSTYLFNPRKIMVDSAGSNYGGIRAIFGLEYMTNKVISCQWHFMHIMEQLAHKIADENQEEFLQLCHALCKKTTIPEYQLVATRLHQIAQKCPIITSKLNWWHVRRWHVFGAFRTGPTHSGVNLAEIGNAAWKTSGSNLTLLAAAKDDVTLFILQDEEIQGHRTSAIMVGGQGPNDLQRAALERQKQRAEARGLAEIVTSREALKLQLELESNPEYFIPGEKSTHKPPKTRQHGVEALPVAQPKPQRGRGRGRGQFRGRGRGRGRFSKLPSATDLARRILEAEQVMAQGELDSSTATTRSQSNIRSSQSEPQIEDETQIEDAAISDGQSQPQPQRTANRRLEPNPESYTPRRSTRGNNPPFVTMFLDRSRYKCIGCNKWINKKDYPHPRDLLFTLKAIRPFLNRKTQEWVHPEKNGYIHLEIKCLQMHDPTIELRQATITDDTFLKLSQQQLQFLAGNGILEHIVSNKEKSI